MDAIKESVCRDTGTNIPRYERLDWRIDLEVLRFSDNTVADAMIHEVHDALLLWIILSIVGWITIPAQQAQADRDATS